LGWRMRLTNDVGVDRRSNLCEERWGDTCVGEVNCRLAQCVRFIGPPKLSCKSQNGSALFCCGIFLTKVGFFWRRRSLSVISIFRILARYPNPPFTSMLSVIGLGPIIFLCVGPSHLSPCQFGPRSLHLHWASIRTLSSLFSFACEASLLSLSSFSSHHSHLSLLSISTNTGRLLPLLHARRIRPKLHFQNQTQ